MLNKLQEILGYKFKDETLLDVAITHASYGNEHNVPSYDRLEFLGDAVLELVISETLYKKYPEDEEGDLSNRRVAIVNNQAIRNISLKLGLNKYMKIHGANTASKAKADIFESVIGAMYLDGGYNVAKSFILDNLSSNIQNSTNSIKKNYKSVLKEKYEKDNVVYKVIKEEGEPHERIYTMIVEINGKSYGPQKGKSKKEAEQACAKIALETLGVIPIK